jgi:hypothetical protein
MHLLGYEEAPPHITQLVSAEYQKAREQKEH